MPISGVYIIADSSSCLNSLCSRLGHHEETALIYSRSGGSRSKDKGWGPGGGGGGGGGGVFPGTPACDTASCEVIRLHAAKPSSGDLSREHVPMPDRDDHTMLRVKPVTVKDNGCRRLCGQFWAGSVPERCICIEGSHAVSGCYSQRFRSILLYLLQVTRMRPWLLFMLG